MTTHTSIEWTDAFYRHRRRAKKREKKHACFPFSWYRLTDLKPCHILRHMGQALGRPRIEEINMLTQEQRDTFRRAVASWNACGGDDVEIDDMISDDAEVVATRETIEDFFTARGRRLNRKGERPEVPYEQERTAFGIVYRWENVQARPGARRGDLFVMDFGDARACYFTGEA